MSQGYEAQGTGRELTAGRGGSGTELRPRYFEHFRERVQRSAPPGCVYHIVPPP